MSRPDFALQPQFSGSYGNAAGLNRGPIGVQDGQDGRHSPSGQGTYIAGVQEGWNGPERPREQGWSAPPREGGGNWPTREPPMMPPGNIISSRGPPTFGEARGRGGPGRGHDFIPRGRGGFGRFDRPGWGGGADIDDGGNRGFAEGQAAINDRPGFGGRGPFRGRGDFRGRGNNFGRWGNRSSGWEGRGRRGWGEDGPKQHGLHDDRPRQPDVDPALLERRRASTAALLKRQVAQLQISRDLMRKDESAGIYARIMESPAAPASQADVRSLYTYPMFSTEDGSSAPRPLAAPSDQTQAFEQCVHMYQELRNGQSIVQSEHGNFVVPAMSD